MNKTVSATVIDYLTEDLPINGQRYALISIVGPHMPQKCDTWALKIRGFADSIESAKRLSAQIMKSDNDYDIYTVDVGKFFPLVVDPYEVKDIEYQNTQLNQLIKSYLENRQSANDMWHKRKNDMMKEAIREGQNQAELAARPEHPVAVLQRIRDFTQRQNELTEALENLKKDTMLAEEKFESFSNDEKELAMKELDSAIKDSIEESGVSTLTVDEIRNEITNTGKVSGESSLGDVIDKLKQAESELEEYTTVLGNTDANTSPNVHKSISEKISFLTQKIDKLKLELTNTELVNEFVNSNYTDSQWDNLSNQMSMGSNA